MAYFVLLNLTSIILSALHSQSESEEEWSVLSELSESWHSLLFLCSNGVLLDVHVCLTTSLTLYCLLQDLPLCLSQCGVL